MKIIYCWLLVYMFSVTISAQQFCSVYKTQEPSGNVPSYNETLQWNIPIVFHIILSSTNEGDVSDAVLQQQMNVLNQRYSSTDFSFYLLGIRRIQNDNWRNLTTSGNDLEPTGSEYDMKTTLAIAPDKVINVYVTTFPNDSKKGTSTFPWNNFALVDNNAYFGIIIRPTVFPGGSDPRNNLGMVLVHEMGHVLGLLHTFFEDYSCHDVDIDQCPDTPPHLPNDICDGNNKACDNVTMAPVFNYMNSVTDDCMSEFTPNQKQRMNQKIQQYRPNIGGTTLTVNNDITIIAGSSLQLMGSATLNFAAGKKIVNAGSLSCSNITMTSGSSWGGIQFNSASSGTIQYCTINNATQGIYIQETNSLTISNSEIFNCSGHGIYAYRTNYATQPIITNCVIHDNSSSTGIVMYWSSPDIRGCNVYNNYNGLGIADYSSPRLGHTSVPGNNNIHNNSNIGVYSLRYSDPLLGRNLSPFQGGNNIIASNTYKDVQAVEYCYVYAENNWWGSAPPNSNKITAISGSTIDYDPFLYSPPSLSVVFSDALASSNSVEKKVVYNELPVNTEQDITNNEILTDTETAYIISQLNSSWRQARTTDLKSFKTYLKDLLDKKERKTINAAAKLILAGYEKEKRISMLEEVILDYDKEPIVETALMSKFLYYFNELKDYKLAEGVVGEISQKFPLSAALLEAQQHIALLDISGQLKNNNGLPNNPSQLANVGDDIITNYPNPFNPTTKISFLLKDGGKVSLKVYDVLGKEVANLAEGYYEAGKHVAAFDGSNLASGIYFYRLVTPTATITKKMVLTK